DGSTAAGIYAECNERLAEDAFRTQGLLEQYNVVAVCTTDDPVDSLEHHVAHARAGTCKTKLLPTWRPDRVLAVEDVVAYGRWLDQLSECSGVEVKHFGSLMQALEKRHSYFHEVGCRL